MSALHSMTLHEQWKTRAADERYETLAAMFSDARAEYDLSRQFTIDLRRLEAVAAPALGGSTFALAPVGAGAEAVDPALLTHWSFGQLSARIGAPAAYLRSLSPALAAGCINEGMRQHAELEAQIYTFRRPAVDASAGADVRAVVRAATSDRYSRIPDWAILETLGPLVEGGAWAIHSAYPQGDFGGVKTPVAGWRSDRDMTVFLVSKDRIADPSSSEGLSRLIVVRNSEVGAASLTVSLALLRYVCGNCILHGLKVVAEITRRHLGGDILRTWRRQIENTADTYGRMSTSAETDLIARASSRALAASSDDAIALLFGAKVLPKSTINAAIDMASRTEPGNPLSVWNVAQGVTRLSQREAFADARLELDRAVPKILAYADRTDLPRA